MTKNRNVDKKYIKKSTMLIIAFLCLIAGFIGGIIYISFSEVSGHNEEDAEVWTLLGNAYFDAGMHEKAVEAYEKSLYIFYDNPDVWTDLGVMYRRTGQPERAIKAFDQAIKINPSHETALFNKSVVYMHDLENNEGAAQALRELIELNPLAKTPNGLPVAEIIKGLENNTE
jgi:tetratricopeptide (TPR) repeat protein